MAVKAQGTDVDKHSLRRVFKALVGLGRRALSSTKPFVKGVDSRSEAAPTPIPPPTEPNLEGAPGHSHAVEPPGSAARRSQLPQTTRPVPYLSETLPSPGIKTNTSILLPPHPLASSRYHRQLLLPSISIRGQTLISSARILIIGLGGLGSPASLYLAALGVHTLGLVDGDTVELSNLHRQIIHRESTVGQSKVASALATLQTVNSEIRLVGFEERFSTANAKRVVEDWRDADGGVWDIVLDCTDNPATRYLISDTCVLSGKVLVSGAAQRTEGQLMVLNYPPTKDPIGKETQKELQEASGLSGGTKLEGPDKKEVGTGTEEKIDGSEGAGKGVTTANAKRESGPCYRCIFPVPPAPETVQSCAEVGVLGPVVGVIGVLMAMEVVKIIIRPADPAKGKGAPVAAWKPSLLLYSALSPDPRSVFRSVGLRTRRKDCVACGDEVVLRAKHKGAEEKRVTWEALADGRVDYEAFCGTVEDVALLGAEHRVAPGMFLEVMEKEDEDVTDRTGKWDPGARPLVVDVREEVEWALGSRVRGSVNVPISKILRYGSGQRGLDQDQDQDAEMGDREVEELLGPGESTNSQPVYFLCQRGNDSQIAADWFLKAGLGRRRRWVGDVQGGLLALAKQVS